MCGRFSQFSHLDILRKYFDIDEVEVEFPSRYNIHPENQIAVIIERDEKRVLRGMKWGLIPFWSKKPTMEYSTINARGETLETRPTFRHSFKNRRCVIPVDGFYEWKGPRGIKAPYYFLSVNDNPLAFAGLYDIWRSEEQTIHSATIVTTCANDLVIPIHDRMPVILTKEQQAIWLDHSGDNLDTIRELMKPYRGDDLASYPVSTYVNSPSNKGPRCIERVPSLLDYFDSN
jgi:putative SOS response-associated peptidase YedK